MPRTIRRRLNRQGHDVGTQYRSAIFYANDEQKQIAEAMIADLTDAKVFHHPIVTTLEPLVAFYPAEAHHQNYVACHRPSALHPVGRAAESGQGAGEVQGLAEEAAASGFEWQWQLSPSVGLVSVDILSPLP